MDSHGLCHWYSQPTPESYVIVTPANVGQHLDYYIFDTSANTSWAKISGAFNGPSSVLWYDTQTVQSVWEYIAGLESCVL